MQTTLAILLTFALRTAAAGIYNLAATIPWAPKAPSSVDQSLIYNGTYYLADRSNAGIHVISLANNSQTNFITGFVTGFTNGTLTTGISGPDGLVILPNRNELYAGDGDGSIKVIDLFTNTVVANITTSSKKRTDEFAYNPSTSILIATNPNETPPFVTIINATTRSIIGNVSFAGASGLEQPAFNPVDSQFWVSVPSTTGYDGGAVQSITTSGTLAIARTLGVPQCDNTGIVFGPSNILFIGCSGSQYSEFGYSASYIMNVSTGAIVANVSGISGIDQVAYSASTGWFYASAYLNTQNGTPAPLLAVIASNGTVLQTITTDNITAHAVAVDAKGDMLVPVKAKGILLYSLNATSSSASPTGTSTGGPAQVTSAAAVSVQAMSIWSLLAGLILGLFLIY